MIDLRARRTRAGLTQVELAARSGVAQPNIAAYESGRRTPTPATVAKLESALAPLPREALREHRGMVVAVLARYKMVNPRVFGSVAHGQDVQGSDIDLLVDAASDLDLLDIADAADELERLLGSHVDIVTSRSLHETHEIARTARAL